MVNVAPLALVDGDGLVEVGRDSKSLVDCLIPKDLNVAFASFGLAVITSQQWPHNPRRNLKETSDVNPESVVAHTIYRER